MYLITGGYDGSSRLSSTEMFTEGQLGWTDVGPLPFAATLLRGVSLNNRIIMTGDNFTAIIVLKCSSITRWIHRQEYIEQHS